MDKIKINTRMFDSEELEAMREKVLKEIHDDPLVYPIVSKELKLSRKEAAENAGALSDLRDDIHYCASCPGYNECGKPHPHYCLKLVRDGEEIKRTYYPCWKAVSLRSFEKRYSHCSFDRDWRDCRFDQISKSAASRSYVLAHMFKIANGEEKRWIYLTGQNGSGKSFMLAAFANEITTRYGKGAYVDTASMLDELKSLSINNKTKFDAVMKELKEGTILVFDDFGNEPKSEYAYTTILFPLISYRAKESLLTAFNSDFTIEQIASMYKPKIGFERADQLTKLLKSLCKKSFDVTGVNVF